MRKIVILAGLLAGAALFTTGTPANAEVGCECVKLGQAPVCVGSVFNCSGMSGVCVAPCDYVASKKMVKHHHHKKNKHHHHKKKMKKEK